MQTGVEWASGGTWNPGIGGCEKVSAECRDCYAISVSVRLGLMSEAGKEQHAIYQGVAEWKDGQPRWTGKVHVPSEEEIRQRAHQLDKRPKGAAVFLTSMSDVLIEQAPISVAVVAIEEILKRGLVCLLLTKRAHRLPELLDALHAAHPDWFTDGSRYGWLRSDLRIGVTAGTKQTAEERIPFLLQVFGVTFVSCEPMVGELPDFERIPVADLGAIVVGDDLRAPRVNVAAEHRAHMAGISGVVNAYTGWTVDSPESDPGKVGRYAGFGNIGWIIFGLESGPKARGRDLEEVRRVVGRARSYPGYVAVFVKQLGTAWAKANGAKSSKGADPSEWPEDLRIQQLPVV